MDRFARMLVALSLTMVLAAACGGREDQSPEAGAAPPIASTDSAASGAGSANEANPLARLTPEQMAPLAQLGKAEIAKAATNKALPPQRKSDYVKIESSDGSAIELPENFNPDLPIFPGSVPSRYVGSDTKGTLTEFDTDESVDTVRRHFSNALGKGGWTLISDLTEEGISLIVAAKDGRDLNVAITEEGGHTKITTIED